MSTQLFHRVRSALIFSAGLLLSGAAHAQATGTPNGAQLDIAHRGASAYAPEHTFFAYDMAMAMDVDMLECDLLLSADEVPVCIHDTTVDRTSNASGNVDSFTLAELRELDFGSWFNDANPTAANPDYVGAKIVPFEEQLDCYLRHNPMTRFHVETKDSAGGLAEQIVAELLTRKGLIDTGDVQTSTILMQSFDAASLEKIKQNAPTLPTAFLFVAPTSGDAAQWAATGVGPDYIDAFAPSSFALQGDVTMVERFHQNGYDVHTWTVNDRATMDAMLDQGVDGIFTNNPDLLRQAIDERGTGTTPEERNNPATFTPLCEGIAGRVTSKNGPGDVWAPNASGRGVHLVMDSGSAPPPQAPSAPVVGVRSSGAAGPFVLLLLLLAGARKLRRGGRVDSQNPRPMG